MRLRTFTIQLIPYYNIFMTYFSFLYLLNTHNSYLATILTQKQLIIKLIQNSGSFLRILNKARGVRNTGT